MSYTVLDNVFTFIGRFFGAFFDSDIEQFTGNEGDRNAPVVPSLNRDIVTH